MVANKLGIAMLAAGIAAAQTFDVAAVKLSESRSKPLVESSPGSVIIDGSFSYILAWTFDLKRYQVSGPAWIGSDRYRIAAKADKPAPVEELQRMMQALLAERFQLKSHREQKELEVYALVVAKGGPKLKASADEGESIRNDAKKTGTGGTLLRTSMAQFADIMDGGLGPDPIVDQTRLKGRYDLTLDLAAAMKGMQAGDFTPILIEGLQKQLGLSLERRKVTMDVLVVDSAAKKPAEN